MPIHLDELDITSEVKGLDSVLITSCNMCAGASLAMKEDKPFLQVFKSLLISPPLERYIKRLQLQLSDLGIIIVPPKSRIVGIPVFKSFKYIGRLFKIFSSHSVNSRVTCTASIFGERNRRSNDFERIKSF